MKSSQRATKPLRSTQAPIDTVIFSIAESVQAKAGFSKHGGGSQFARHDFGKQCDEPAVVNANVLKCVAFVTGDTMEVHHSGNIATL